MTTTETNTSRTPLVDCAWLADHLDDPNVRVIEVSNTPDDSAYREGHVPGALWWFWKDALWHESDREFPTPAEMALRLSSIGITEKTTIVIFGSPVNFGSYAFWVLRMCGHRDIRFLDGGRKRWVAEGRPMTKDIPQFPTATYVVQRAKDTSRVGRDDVLAKLDEPGRVLLDVRTPEEYSGERVSPATAAFDSGAERKGRIPGAIHLFFRELLNEDDTFKTPDEMRAILEGVGVSTSGDGEIVTYCRLSHRASLAWLVLESLLGIPNVRVYDGSWTEWGSIVGFPVERD